MKCLQHRDHPHQIGGRFQEELVQDVIDVLSDDSYPRSQLVDHWSWPTTRAHENFHKQVVTTTTCLKHGTVRLYNLKEMRIATWTEERRVLAETPSRLLAYGKAGSRQWVRRLKPIPS